jgi:hypothetical protein
VEYDGIRQRHDPEFDIDETLIDPRKIVMVAKEETSLYVEGLQPQMVYTFNISAKFIDGSWGPSVSIPVETGAEGGRR